MLKRIRNKSMAVSAVLSASPAARLLLRLQAPGGAKFVDAAHGMAASDLGEDIGEIGLRVEIVHLAVSMSEAWTAQWRPLLVGACEEVVPCGWPSAMDDV